MVVLLVVLVMRLIGGSAFAQLRESFNESEDEGSSFFSNRDAKVDRMESVSYTHLDVYQRKVPDPHSRCFRRQSDQEVDFS